jgi:hypothetical protein
MHDCEPESGPEQGCQTGMHEEVAEVVTFDLHEWIAIRQ